MSIKGSAFHRRQIVEVSLLISGGGVVTQFESLWSGTSRKWNKMVNVKTGGRIFNGFDEKCDIRKFKSSYTLMEEVQV